MSWLGHDNRVLTGAITVSAAVEGMGAAQLRDVHGASSSAWQTPFGTLAGQLDIDSGDNASQWQAFALCRTNLTAAATLRVRVGNDAAFATSAYDSGTIGAGVAADVGQAVHFIAAAIAGRHARINIDDPFNPDGFLHVPLAFAGPGWTVAMGITPASADGDEVVAAEARTRGGQEYVELRHARRAWELAMEAVLDASERRDRLAPLLRAAADGRNVLTIPRLDGDMAREAVFGRLQATTRVGWQAGIMGWRTVRLLATERM